MSDLPLLAVQATSERYRQDFGSGVVGAMLDGPSTQIRKGYSAEASLATVTWELDQTGYSYFKAFWRQRVGLGAGKFLIDVVSAEALPTRSVASFVPGTLKLSKFDGAKYIVTATIELSRLLVP